MTTHHYLSVSSILLWIAWPVTAQLPPQALITPERAVFILPPAPAPTDSTGQMWIVTWDEASWRVAGQPGLFGIMVHVPDSADRTRPFSERVPSAQRTYYWTESAGSIDAIGDSPEPALQVKAFGLGLMLELGPSEALSRLNRIHPDSLRFYTQATWDHGSLAVRFPAYYPH